MDKSTLDIYIQTEAMHMLKEQMKKSVDALMADPILSQLMITIMGSQGPYNISLVSYSYGTSIFQCENPGEKGRNGGKSELSNLEAIQSDLLKQYEGQVLALLLQKIEPFGNAIGDFTPAEE